MRKNNFKNIIIKNRFYFIVIIAVIAFSSAFFTSYTDIKDTHNFSVIENENIFTENFFGNYGYYVYKNYAFIRDTVPETKKANDEFLLYLTENYSEVFIYEQFDYDKYFTGLKDSIDKSVLKKINYAHYIKKEEIDKYTDSIVIQRFIRANRERKMKILIFPAHERSPGIINEVKKEIGNGVNTEDVFFNERPVFIKYTGFLLSAFSLFIYEPVFSLVYILFYLFFYNWSFTVGGILFTLIIYFRISGKNTVKIIFYSVLFGVSVYLSGYDYYMVYKLMNVRGIKLLLTVLPLFAVLKVMKDYKFKKPTKNDIIYLIMGLAAFGIYILRSGNYGFTSDFERSLRDSSEKILGARPRTKELFSYFFFVLKPTKNLLPLWALFRSILICSVTDTFLHVHTPVYLGILRSFYGFVFYFIITLIFIFFKSGKEVLK